MADRSELSDSMSPGSAPLRSRRHFWSTAYDYALTTAGGLLLAVNLNLFLAPAKIAPGGVSGSAIIINEFTGWPIGLTMLVLNVPMIVLGFLYLGRFAFLARTLYAVLVYNLGVDLLAPWLPAAGIADDMLLNALYGGIVAGLGTGLVYRSGGTTAGTGTLSRVIQMKTGIPISQVYFLTDGGVILIAGLVFGWEAALYAMITLFVWGLAADYVLEGPSVVRMAFIVTDEPGAVAHALLDRLHLGVTTWPVEGAFTEHQHTILFCTVGRPRERALRTVVAEVDPHAFVVTGHGHQATGGMLGQTRRPGQDRHPRENRHMAEPRP
ncbi:MAG: YitT family protein [Candidatus Thermoplasmatota archaeon]|nr:YitT family protein [Candidatus Thermoplasmatota archaeon]